jgi:hypothetical protein
VKNGLKFLLAVVALIGSVASAAAQDIRPGGVLVLGGTGRAGSHIARLLVVRGETVSVLARPNSDRKRRDDVNVVSIEGDALVAVNIEVATMKARPRVAINALGRPATSGASRPSRRSTSPLQRRRSA